METLSALSAKLSTTKDIQSIVRTMKSLSSVSIHHYEEAVAAIADYERTIALGLQALLRDGAGRGGPLLRPDGGGERSTPPAIIVVGSDRGLCGRFNDTVARFAAERLAEVNPGLDGRRARLCVLGVRAADRLEASGHRAEKLYHLPGSVDGVAAAVQRVAVDIEAWTREHSVSRVELVFNRRTGGSLASPTLRTVFPVPQAEIHRLATTRWPSRALPIHRMDRQHLLSWLLGEYLFVALYRGLAQSLASEHASRLAAMRGAERNIEERSEALMSEYRKQRQESITRELLDLISGFGAVTTDGGAAAE